MTKSRRSKIEGAFRAHITEECRPWGRFRVYPHHEARSLKIITVRPGAALSLQYHRRRSEFWVALDPGLEITVGDRVWRLKRGEEVFIPRGMPHRLRAVGKRSGRVMELWIGASREDDIVRLSDVYGRS
jgi:mannose-6-phosphate isomerase-like protein (cupin superfamily)